MIIPAGQFLLRVVLLAFLGACGCAIAGSDPNPPLLTITPDSPPANQEFAAVFHFYGNPNVAGFWGETHPQYRIDGNMIIISFDPGCGFLCPPGDPEYTAHPFTMPALSAGPHIVRFAVGLDPTAPVLGEFNINVGTGVAGPTQLPVGGHWTLLLAVLVILLATAQSRHTRKNMKAVV